MTKAEEKILKNIKLGKNKVKIFWDMDGTCASMEMQDKEHKAEPGFFYSKRPINTIIRLMKQFHDLGAETYILGYCSYNYQKDDKIRWLKEHCGFISNDNIVIIPRREKRFQNIQQDKRYLKAEILKSYISPNDTVYMIDDNESVLLGTQEIIPFINIISPIDFID